MADKSAHKERTRARILDVAAQALRASGTEGVSVGALMKRAGLTHGGFYAHFASRDDLVAHAVDRMFRDSSDMLDRFLVEDAGPEQLRALIDYYLSERAFAAPERSCPLPGLVGEVPRMPPQAQVRFEAGIAAFRARLTRIFEGMGRTNAARAATSMLAELVGSMALARSTSDRAMALAILADARGSLIERLGLS